MPIVHSLYREGGAPRIDREKCRLCGQCAAICPSKVLIMRDGEVRVSPESAFGCIACGHCMMMCPEGAVTVTGRGISPEDILPLPSEEERATAGELEALMHARRSIRHFTNRDVEKETIERITAMASSAPMGIPPWDIGCIAVCGRERVREIAAEVVKGYEGFLRIFKPWRLKMMRPFMGQAKYEQFMHFVRPLAEEYVNGWREGRDTLFYDAPALLIFHHSPYAESADAAIACTYAMLAAESLGLGNVIIGGAPPVIQRDKELSRRLRIPEGNTACFALILGYPAVRFKHAIRRHFTQNLVVC